VVKTTAALWRFFVSYIGLWIEVNFGQKEYTVDSPLTSYSVLIREGVGTEAPKIHISVKFAFLLVFAARCTLSSLLVHSYFLSSLYLHMLLSPSSIIW